MKKYFSLLSILFLLLIMGCSTPNVMGEKVKREYFTGGLVRSEFVMDDDTGQNGLLKRYGYNGKITSTVPIRNGVKDGIETGFDDRGRIIWKLNYVNGEQEGKQYAYYPNGNVMVLYTYVHGIKHGVARTFNKDGSVNKEVIYNHDKIMN